MAIVRVPTSSYPTIRSAIAAASAGDTIELGPDYSNETATVTVNNLSFVGHRDYRGTYTNAGIVLNLWPAAEIVTVSGWGWVVNGNGLGNEIVSVRGNNTLRGGGGDDVLVDGDGRNHLEGGAGNDVLVPQSFDEGYSLYDGGSGFDTLLIEHTRRLKDLNIKSIEKVTFKSGENKVEFRSDQIGLGELSKLLSVSVEGAADFDRDTIIIDVTHGGRFDLSGWSFSNWHWSYIQHNGLRYTEDNTLRINGSSDGNIIIGSRVSDDIRGGGSDDYLKGNAGDDRIDGGQGNDTVDGGSGADRLEDYDGDDRMNGGLGDDFLSGGDGTDVLVGGVGNDVLYGGSGNDIIDGGAGSDRVSFFERSGPVIVRLNGSVPAGVTIGGVREDSVRNVENVKGGGGDDILIGDHFDNHLSGGGGEDVLDGGAGRDTLGYESPFGGAIGVPGASIVLKGSTSTVVYFGDVKADTIKNFENVFGGFNDDSIIGDEANNLFRGGQGDDRLDGGGGVDTADFSDLSDVVGIFNITAVLAGSADVEVRAVCSGPNALPTFRLLEIDTIRNIENIIGGAGDDSITGDTLANRLDGGTGRDRLAGAGGNDTLLGGEGADTMLGGLGNDIYVVDSAADRIVEADGQGADVVSTSVSYALARGVYVETLQTRGLTTVASIDLTGNELANTLIGNAGANTLNGRAGNDTLNGGSGTDFFLFNSALNAATNVDSIADFNVAQDTIRLDNAVFTALAVGALPAGAFNTGAAATQADDRIIYNTATGALIYDWNGSTAGGATQFAKLAAGLALTNADFVVV